jgi:hypothetical protein
MGGPARTHEKWPTGRASTSGRQERARSVGRFCPPRNGLCFHNTDIFGSARRWEYFQRSSKTSLAGWPAGRRGGGAPASTLVARRSLWPKEFACWCACERAGRARARHSQTEKGGESARKGDLNLCGAADKGMRTRGEGRMCSGARASPPASVGPWRWTLSAALGRSGRVVVVVALPERPREVQPAVTNHYGAGRARAARFQVRSRPSGAPPARETCRRRETGAHRETFQAAAAATTTARLEKVAKPVPRRPTDGVRTSPPPAHTKAAALGPPNQLARDDQGPRWACDCHLHLDRLGSHDTRWRLAKNWYDLHCLLLSSFSLAPPLPQIASERARFSVRLLQLVSWRRRRPEQRPRF